MNIQAQNFQTGQRLTAKDLNDLKNAVMNPNISLGDGLVGSSGNGSITIQKSESLNKKAKEYTNTVWQLKSAPSQRFIHEDSDGNRYPSLYVYVGSTLANAFENINIQNQWIAQGTKPTALYLLNGKESPKCTTYLAEVDEKGAITKGDEVDISLDTAASQTEIDLQSDFYAKDKDIGIDGWLELPVAIVDATGTYMCVFEQGPLLVVGLFFCDLQTQKNVYNQDEQLSASYISYSIEPNIVDIIETLIGSSSIAAWGGMIGNPVPMFSCRPLTDYETIKAEFLDKNMVVDLDTFKVVSQFKNVQQFQFIDTVSQMPYAFKPVFLRAVTGDVQEKTHVNFGWVLNLTVPEMEAPSSYDIDGVLDNKYQSKFKKVTLTKDLIIKDSLGGDTYRYVDLSCVVKCEQIGVNGSSMYIGVLNNSEDENFPDMTMSGTPFGKMPICLAGGLDAIVIIADPTHPEYWLPIDDSNSKTVVLKCVPVWCPELGDYIYSFYSEITSTDSLETYWVGTLNGVAQRENIVASLLPNSQKKWVGSEVLKNDEQILFNIGLNDNIRFRPLTPAYQTVDLRNIAATMPYTDAMYIDGKAIRENIIKDVAVQSAKNYALLASEYADTENKENGNQYESRTGSISYRIEDPGNRDAHRKMAIQLMGFGQDMPISVSIDGPTNYGQDKGNISSIINNDFVIRHYLFDEPGELSSNNTHAVVDYVNMQSLLSAWTELCCQTSVDISAITDAVLSADNADWQNRYFLKCRVNDDPEDSNYGKVQVFLGKTTSRLDAHCTVGGMPVNYYRDKNDNVLASDDKGWCTLPYSPGSKLYYWIGAEWDSSYNYKYYFYITDVQMIPSYAGKEIVREEGFLYYQNANPNVYAYDLADYTATGDVRKTNIDDASSWANRIYNIHLGDIHCNPFPNEIEPFTFGLGRDGYWKVYEGGDYLVYYNNDSINKHTSMLAVSTPPYGYNSADGWADTGIPLTADVNLYFIYSNGSGNSQSLPEWDFSYGSLMPFSNGIRLVAGNNWDGTGIPTEITQYHKGKIFIDYDMGDVDFSDSFNPEYKSYSIERKDDSNDHFKLYQFASTTPTLPNKVLQWSDTDPEYIDDSLQFAVKSVGVKTNTLEYVIPLMDAGRVNDLSAAIAELSGSVPSPGDIEQMLNDLSAALTSDILNSTDGKYWHLGNQSTSEAYGSVIGNSNQDTVIDLDHLMLDGSDWTVMNSFMVNGNLDVHNDCNLYGTLYYQTYEWQSAPINVGDDFMTILVASNIGDPETIINAIENGIQNAIAWSNAVAASSYGTYQGVLNAIGNAAQAAQNAQNAANAAQGAANAAQAGVNALDSQINGANGIDSRLSAAESNVTALNTMYDGLSGDVDTIGNQLNIQGQAIHNIANTISGDIVPAINSISSVVNNNVTQITNIDGRVTNIENNYTTVTNNISTLSTDVGTLSNGLSSAQSSIDSINQNKADLSALNDLSDSLSNYVEKYTTEVQTISTPLVDLQPLSAFELNAAYGNDAVGIFKPYGTVTLNNSSGDKTTLYPARMLTERVGPRIKQVYHNPEIVSHKESTSANYTLTIPYKNGTIAVEEELSNYTKLSAFEELSDSLSNYLSSETDPDFHNWLSSDFIAAGISATTSADVDGDLPYDAELEYIEKTSASESYFDTGFTPLWNDTIQSKWSINENKSVFFYMAREGLNKPARGFLKVNIANTFRADRVLGTSGIVTNFSPNAPAYTLGTWFEVFDEGTGGMQLVGLNCGYNGTPNTGTAGTVNGTLRLFAGAAASTYAPMKFGYMRIFSGAANTGTAVLKLDLIPVRVGNVAYVYDRVSKTLISKVGADDIVCGPDKRRTAVAVGSQAYAEERSVAIGSTANAVDSINNKFGSVAIGDGAKAVEGVAIGPDAEANCGNFNLPSNAVAIGKNAYAKGISIAIGTNAVSGKSTGSNVCQSIAIGRNSGPRDTDKTGVIHIGYNNTHPNLQNDAVAIGSTVGTVGSSGVAIGRNSQQSGGDGVAIGYNANGNGARGVSIGRNSQGTGSDAVALGYNSKATQNYSTAVGQNAETTGTSGTGSSAFGSGAQAKSNGGLALGGAAFANYDAAIAIGKYAKTNVANAITIGSTNDSNNPITNTLSGSVQFWDWTAFKRNANNTNLILDPDRLPDEAVKKSMISNQWEENPSDVSCSFSNVGSGFTCSVVGVAVNRIAGLVRLRINIVNTAARTATASVNVATIAFTGFTPLSGQFRYNGYTDANARMAFISTNSSWQIYMKPLWALSATSLTMAFTMDLATNSFSMQ